LALSGQIDRNTISKQEANHSPIRKANIEQSNLTLARELQYETMDPNAFL
jgi:hypothetical protein